MPFSPDVASGEATGNTSQPQGIAPRQRHAREEGPKAHHDPQDHETKGPDAPGQHPLRLRTAARRRWGRVVGPHHPVPPTV